MARIKASGARTLEELDFSDALFQLATISELALAVQEAAAATAVPMEGVIRRWMGLNASWNAVGSDRSHALSEVLFANLQTRIIVSGCSYMMVNDVVAVQLLYKLVHSRVLVVHVQMLSDMDFHGYYLHYSNRTFKKLQGDLPECMMEYRTPFTTIGEEVRKHAMSWKNLVDPADWEKPLHDHISKILF